MLRDATDADLDAMRRWRNHDEVRRVSLTQHEIGADAVSYTHLTLPTN